MLNRSEEARNTLPRAVRRGFCGSAGNYLITGLVSGGSDDKAIETNLRDFKVYKILEAAKDHTSGNNFVSLDRLRMAPRATIFR